MIYKYITIYPYIYTYIDPFLSLQLNGGLKHSPTFTKHKHIIMSYIPRKKTMNISLTLWYTNSLLWKMGN